MSQQNTSKALHTTLWVAQVITALCLLSGTVMKFMPIETISPMMPWTGELPPIVVRLLGIIDLLGAAGLILQALWRIKPQLTAWAAVGTVILMGCAIAFHVLRGEASVIGFNIFLASLAIFIAWGRFQKVPVEAR